MKHEFSPQKEQQRAAQQHDQQSTGREFESVDEMLRFDAQRIPIPPRIADRLGESLGGERPARGSWWKRLFGK